MRDDEQAQRFLLGEMTEDERAVLEDRLLADDDETALLGAAEDDLRDAYARGELSPERRARFEARFVTTPDQRRQVAIARLLAARAAAVTPLRRRARRAPMVLALGGALAAAAVIVIIVASRPREPAPAAATISLAVVTRGSEAPTVTWPPSATSVVLAPQLDGLGAARDLELVLLRPDGSTVAGPGVASSAAPVLDVPVASLAAGSYELHVRTIPTAKLLGVYPFVIAPR